ncbi:hypothetical protein ACGFOU_03945 [Streptomyces sp. NPDC048595]|uniref:hypothetical protein n=1 Tax=Streptomyces sp. NPDC048595 TaxID=3365576 RepID=UPI0037143968
MVFDNIFSFAREGAKSGETTGEGLLGNIPGTSPGSRIVREDLPEAHAVLGFIGNLAKVTQSAAEKQSTFAGDPASTSGAASATAAKAAESMQRDGDVKKYPGPAK